MLPLTLTLPLTQVVEEIDEEEYKPEITTGIGEDAAKYAW